MKIIKHFYKVASRLWCKHESTKVASCPFTGYTYISCSNCFKYVDISETK